MPNVEENFKFGAPYTTEFTPIANNLGVLNLILRLMPLGI